MRGRIFEQRLSEPHKKQLQCAQSLNGVPDWVRHGYRFCGASCSSSASLCLLVRATLGAKVGQVRPALQRHPQFPRASHVAAVRPLSNGTSHSLRFPSFHSN